MAKEAKELKRVNLRMSPDIYDVYKSRADSLGVPLSAVIVMALAEYNDMKTAISIANTAMKRAQGQADGEKE